MDGDGHPDRIVFVDQGEHVVALKPPIKTERRRTLCRLIVILLAAFGTSAVYIHHRLANKRTHRTEGPKTEGVVHAYFLLDRTGSMGALNVQICREALQLLAGCVLSLDASRAEHFCDAE